MAKKNTTKTGGDEPQENKIPFSTLLVSQLTEFSPRGFFVLVFDSEGNPNIIPYAENNISRLAIDKALEDVVEESRLRREEEIFSRIQGGFGSDN